MFCRECGKKIKDEAVVCAGCGYATELGLESDIETSQGDTKPQEMFSAPFSFNGRIRRLEYGLSILLPMVLIQFLGFFLFFRVTILLLIPYVWFSWAQGAKRCHDRGNSGWYQFIPFYSLWMLFGDGEIGDNEYGSDPKGYVRKKKE